MLCHSPIDIYRNPCSRRFVIVIRTPRLTKCQSGRIKIFSYRGMCFAIPSIKIKSNPNRKKNLSLLFFISSLVFIVFNWMGFKNIIVRWWLMKIKKKQSKAGLVHDLIGVRFCKTADTVTEHSQRRQLVTRIYRNSFEWINKQLRRGTHTQHAQHPAHSLTPLLAQIPLRKADN